MNDLNITTIFNNFFFDYSLLPSNERSQSSSSSSSSSSESIEAVHGNRHMKNIMPRRQSSLDWNKLGYVSPAQFQGSCGCCYAFATSSLIESHYAIKLNLTNKVPKLSKQQIVDCSRDFGNFGCEGGFFEGTFKYIVAANGLDRESSYPYNAVEGDKCRFKKSEVAVKITGYRRLADNERIIRKTVEKIGPVLVGFQACDSLESYSKGIYEDSNCGRGNVELNHAVLITGYGSENGKDYWIVKNSWGSSWGENGFFRIVRGNRACGLGMESFIPKL